MALAARSQAAGWHQATDRAADHEANQRVSPDREADGRGAGHAGSGSSSGADAAAGSARPGRTFEPGRAFGPGRDYRRDRDDRLGRRPGRTEPWQSEPEPGEYRAEPREYRAEPREYRAEPRLTGQGGRDHAHHEPGQSDDSRPDLGASRRAQREPPGPRGPSPDDFDTGQIMRPPADSPLAPEGHRPSSEYRGGDSSEQAPVRRRPPAESYREPDGHHGLDGHHDPDASRGRDDYRGRGAYDGYQSRAGHQGPPDGYRARDGYRGPEEYRAPDGYRDPRPDSYRGLEDDRAPDGYRGPDGYRRPEEYRAPDGYRGPDGYRRPEEYRAPDGYRDPRPDGYRGPEQYRRSDGYRDPRPDGYRGPDEYRRPDGYREQTGGRGRGGYRDADDYGAADSRYLDAEPRLDGYPSDGRRPNGAPRDDHSSPEGGAWRPESYGDTTSGRQVHERDVYVVTDLPERRASGYRPNYDDERRGPDRLAGARSGGVRGPDHDGFRPDHDGFGPPVLGPDGRPLPDSVRLGASHADRRGSGHQQVPGIDSAERDDPQTHGALRPVRQDAPRMPAVPLELPAGSRDVPPGGEGGPVPLVIDAVSQPAIVPIARNEDQERTSPLPVILPGATSVPRPETVVAPRGPFEAARPSRLPSVTGSVEPPPAANAVIRPTAALAPLPPPGALAPSSAPAAPTASPVPEPPPHIVPEAATAKLDQLKDLYFAAEAIGEDRLDRHFDQVSQRQRDLIREFFERSKPAG